MRGPFAGIGQLVVDNIDACLAGGEVLPTANDTLIGPVVVPSVKGSVVLKIGELGLFFAASRRAEYPDIRARGLLKPQLGVQAFPSI